MRTVMHRGGKAKGAEDKMKEGERGKGDEKGRITE